MRAMTIERYMLMIVLASGINLVCVLLLALATYYNVRNYTVLRQLQRLVESGDDVPRHGAPTRRGSTPARAPKRRSTRYDSFDDAPREARVPSRTSPPDDGQSEWTGPVETYVPANRS
jgi:hypothetical protein